MRNTIKFAVVLVTTSISTAVLAGTNDLFEIKTATDALEQSSKKLLSHVTPADPFGEMPNADVATAKALPAGSFWSVPANSIHTTACGDDENCLFYFHAEGAFDFNLSAE